MTLKESRVDHSYRVVKIHGSGPFKRRIMDMGITKNAEIYIRKVAPLGFPAKAIVMPILFSFPFSPLMILMISAI